MFSCWFNATGNGDLGGKPFLLKSTLFLKVLALLAVLVYSVQVMQV